MGMAIVKDRRKSQRELLFSPCETRDKLRAWLDMFVGLRMPQHPVCPHHQSPMDYPWHAYREPADDVIVWASRGGGKTRLGAAATLLDLLHKPGVQVRILGGSMEQSCRMWEYLLPDLERLIPHEVVKSNLGRAVAIANGSRAAVLSQSQKAVRGLRVQKLRCDEVELFDDDVWQAAQLVTRTATLDFKPDPPDADPVPTKVKGVVEALSTFHKPWGLMSRVIERGRAGGTRVVHWCVLDVLEKCPPERDCHTCPLQDDCGGIAKEKCDGFFSIDDPIATVSAGHGNADSPGILDRGGVGTI